MATSLSSQLLSSKDGIVSQITDYIKTYLELENITLIKGSFLSFLVETLSILTSNLMFYESSVYNEFFLTKAKLPESIFNLASFLGYNTQEASYSQANVLMTVPLTFTSSDVTFTIPEDFEFKAQNIPFVTYYSTSVNVLNNNQVSINITNGNKIYNLPVIIDSTSSDPEFKFILPLRQYENNVQEFQIDEDLQTYQFTHIDVPLTGKVSTMTVKIREPDETSYRTYTEFTSTYLMSADDYGYVSRRTETGRRIYFGNGLIGIQPAPGSTVQVTIQETQGLDGNVIAGSITSGERIYTSDNGITKIVDYTVTNSSPATNGEDEEGIEDIRINAINNLTALNRLVTENDYQNIDTIVSNTPIQTGSKPVLKRSDVRVNEIQLYTSLLYGSDLVPTKNLYSTFSPDTTYVPRGTTINFDNVNYYTLFDMTIDSEINNSAYYTYIMNTISQIPLLVRSYDPVDQFYILPLSNLMVTRNGNSARFEMLYDSSESDYENATCQMSILSSGINYDMTNSYDVKKFILDFDDYNSIPSGEETYYFNTKDPDGNNIAEYSNKFTFRQSLNSFMLSNLSSDSTSVIVYDIPVIKSSYYNSDDFVEYDFETQVLQSILNNIDFNEYRMLTDFVNLKFTNTTGSMNNMLLNKTTKLPIIDISSLPTSPELGDRYIVGECENNYSDYRGQIAQCIDSTNVSWSFTVPTSNDIIYIQNEGYNYVYNGKVWILPMYHIPLNIDIEVFKESNYSGSNIELSNLIKETLLSEFSSTRFGANNEIYRSEIIKSVQSINGVSYCILISPETDIYFNFELDELTEDQLLKYSPEYMYFDSDSISVRIL